MDNGTALILYAYSAAQMHALPRGHVAVERLASAVSGRHVLSSLTPSSLWLGRTITSVSEHRGNIAGMKNLIPLLVLRLAI